MQSYTPLDISAFQKKLANEGSLNRILITLTISTVVIIGFIIYLFITKY